LSGSGAFVLDRPGADDHARHHRVQFRRRWLAGCARPAPARRQESVMTSTGSTEGTSELLSVRGLKVEFSTEAGTVPAVDGVSFDLHPGEILALVGESGCGKSATALALLRLIADPPGRITAGEVVFRGNNLLKA